MNILTSPDGLESVSPDGHQETKILMRAFGVLSKSAEANFDGDTEMAERYRTATTPNGTGGIVGKLALGSEIMLDQEIEAFGLDANRAAERPELIPALRRVISQLETHQGRKR